MELRINQVTVEPGEVTTPHTHTHEGQEEVFVALTEGQIAIEGEVHDAVTSINHHLELHRSPRPPVVSVAP